MRGTMKEKIVTGFVALIASAHSPGQLRLKPNRSPKAKAPITNIVESMV